MGFVSLSLVVVVAAVAGEPRFFTPQAWAVAEGSSPVEAERSRIRQHLLSVEETLRRETPSTLAPEQRASRLRLMDSLHAYSLRGDFPTNRDAHRRVPVFIDADGTACAMGHLILASGADALAREIATYENNDFIADIDHPQLPGWLQSHGLTAAEAAWIQPSYGPCGYSGFDPQYVCGADGRTYECEIAAQCADVEVVSEGSCSAGTGTGAGTSTGGPPSEPDVVLADEVCELGTTGTSTGGDLSTTGEPGSDEGTTGAGSQTSSGAGATASSGASSTEEGSSAGPGSDQGDRDSGCRVGGSTAPPWALALMAVAFLRRRRNPRVPGRALRD